MEIVRVVITVLMALIAVIFTVFGVFSKKGTRGDAIAWVIVDCILLFAMYFMWV